MVINLNRQSMRTAHFAMLAMSSRVTYIDTDEITDIAMQFSKRAAPEITKEEMSLMVTALVDVLAE